MRKLIVVLLLGLSLVGLTSCYDANEIDDMLHVVAIGVDKGISDKWRLTIQFAALKESGGKNSGGTSQSGSGGDSQGEYSYVSIDAPSFFTGINMLNTSLPRRLNFMHAQIIVFSEEIAKSGLISEYIAPISRFRQIRRTSHVFVVKGKALDFIKDNKPSIGSLLSKDYELFLKESENTGYFPHVTLQSFYESLKSTCHQPIATIGAVNDSQSFLEEGEAYGTEFNTGGNYLAGQIPRLGNNKIEFFGTALFDGDIMVGELTGDETRYLLMTRGEFKRGTFLMQDPQQPNLVIPLDVRMSKKPDVKITFNGTKPIINLKIALDADLLAVQSNINYEQPELKAQLEQRFQENTKKGIEELVEKCKKLNVDVLKFGDYAVRNFSTIETWEKYNWQSHFKEAEVKVEVEFAIRRTGTQIKNYPIVDSEGAD